MLAHWNQVHIFGGSNETAMQVATIGLANSQISGGQTVAQGPHSANIIAGRANNQERGIS